MVAGVVGTTGAAAFGVKSQADHLQAQLTDQLKAGQTELEAAKTSLKLANTNHDLKELGAAKQHFANARTQFDAAAKLADGSGLLKSIESLPTLGQLARTRHVAVDGIAGMGVALSEAGSDVSDIDAQLIKPAGAPGQQGQTLLAVLQSSGSSLPKIHAELVRAQAAAATVDAGLVPAGQRASFVKARAEINAAVVDIEEFQRLVPVLIEVLGGNGPRNYLLEQVNPAELRAGGGFIGSYSLLQADKGALKLVQSGNGYQLSSYRPPPWQPGYVTPPGPIKEFVPTVSWSFVDSNWFADFPSNAKEAEHFVDPQLKAPLDGVMSIDYYTVAKLLEITGPMAVPGYPGVTIDSTNFVPLLIKYDLEQGYTHKAILSAIAGPLLQKVMAVPASQWGALIAALSELSAQRHIQAYFNDSAVEDTMTRYGWSGVMNPTAAGDYMLEVESNLGGTKANYFVVRHYTVYLTLAGTTLHHKVVVDITNTMPVMSGTGNFYHGYFRLYVSADATAMSNNLVRVRYPNPPPPAGTVMLDGWMPKVNGTNGHGQAVFEYNTPWQPDSTGSEQLYWQKQPGTVGDKVQVVWANAGNTYSASGDLNQDCLLTLGPSSLTLAPGQPAKTKLPSLSL